MEKENTYDPSPESKAWCLSRLLLTWTNTVIKRGVRLSSDFKEKDLYDVDDKDKFNNLRNELKDAQTRNPKASLMSQIVDDDKCKIMFYILLSMIANGLQFAGPYCLKLIIDLL